jgi:hypothetical protein
VSGERWALDLCCGLGGWAHGLKAEGWRVVGVDSETSFAGLYPGDVFIRADVRRMPWGLIPPVGLVVASPPCQEFSRHDQPWTKKRNPPPPDLSIWRAVERLAQLVPAPCVIENVRGAQPFVGSAEWHYGPYYFWGSVPLWRPRLSIGRPRKGFEWWGQSGQRSAELPHRDKQSRTSAAVAERSMVPLEISRWIGRAFSL